MCGIVGVVAKGPVNQLLYDALLVLQHRGQDAAGIVTSEHKTFHMHKGAGLVRCERRGTSLVYTLQSSVLEDVAAEILDLVPSRRRRASAT